MSKTTQDNSNVENSATESVSNTSKARTRTTKTANTTSVAATAASTQKNRLVLQLQLHVVKVLHQPQKKQPHHLLKLKLLVNRTKL